VLPFSIMAKSTSHDSKGTGDKGKDKDKDGPKQTHNKAKQRASASPRSQIHLRPVLLTAGAAIVVLALLAYSYTTFLRSELESTTISSTVADAKSNNDTLMNRARTKHPPEIRNELFRPQASGQIATAPWKVGKRFLRDILAGGRPVLIRDSPIKDWKLSSLDLLELAQISRSEPEKAKRKSKRSKRKQAGNDTEEPALLMLNHTRYQAREPVFILNYERDKGGMIGSAHDRPLLHTDVSLLEFLGSTFSDSVYLYYTAPLRQFEQAYKAINATVAEGSQSSGSGLNETSNVTNATTAAAEEEETSFFRHSVLAETWNTLAVVDPALQQSLSYDDEELWDPTLWLSHPGVVTQMHYDTTHNFFAHLQGLKKVYLVPPQAEICQYPNVHRSYRQSQILLESSLCPQQSQRSATSFRVDNRTLCEYVDQTICAGLEANLATVRAQPAMLEPVEVTLQPGDLLYIPPYFSHRIEALTLSLSVSTLSPSAAEAAASELFSQQVPFGGFQKISRKAQAAAVRVYLGMVFQSLSDEYRNAGNGSGQDLFYASEYPMYLFQTRFKRLFPMKRLMDIKGRADKGLAASSPSAWDLCGFEYSSSGTDRDKDKDGDFDRRLISSLLEENAASFQDTASTIAGLLMKLPVSNSSQDDSTTNAGLSVRDGVIRTVLGDYVEQLSRWAVGPELVPLFLVECLADVRVAI
jgi:hypothetical protein